jgi:hypothetical protein
MKDCGCAGSGKFMLGMAMGMAVGGTVGMMMNTPRRQMKRAANSAVKRVNEALDHLSDAMDF